MGDLTLDTCSRELPSPLTGVRGGSGDDTLSVLWLTALALQLELDPPKGKILPLKQWEWQLEVWLLLLLFRDNLDRLFWDVGVDISSLYLRFSLEGVRVPAKTGLVPCMVDGGGVCGCDSITTVCAERDEPSLSAAGVSGDILCAWHWLATPFIVPGGGGTEADTSSETYTSYVLSGGVA